MHVPVLLQSTIELLAIKTGETVVDATLGLGGHALALGEKIGQEGTLIGFDLDAQLLAKAKSKLEACPGRKIFINKNFRHLKQALVEEGIKSVDAVLFDFGLNSEHFDLALGRGFSFKRDEPLLMTLSNTPGKDDLTARDIVNTWSAESLADIIYAYGEEPLARRIARALVSAREIKSLETTFDLIAVLETVMPQSRKHAKIHFATKTFQALRITVNDELGALRDGLTEAWSVLNSGGRLAAISFHSLEARLVKEFFKNKVSADEGALVNKKVVKPSQEEVLANPRSRSSQLRVIKKIS